MTQHDTTQHNTKHRRNLGFSETLNEMAASKESVDYSEDGGLYNGVWDRWEWTDDDGRPHREGDNPAFIYIQHETRIWCRYGEYEKLVTPDDVEYSLEGSSWEENVRFVWYDEYGELHQDGDNPAIIFKYGTRVWCRHGKYEKFVTSDGVEYSLEGGRWDGHRWTWYDENGYFHRDGDNPALIYCGGSLTWYVHGEKHRLAGPVEIHGDGRRPMWRVDKKHFWRQDEFEAARDLYCKEHNIAIPGRKTKRAT